MQIENAIALVTGANGGIGAEFVTALHRAGAARIYACTRKLESLSELVAADPERIVPIALRRLTDTIQNTSIKSSVSLHHRKRSG